MTIINRTTFEVTCEKIVKTFDDGYSFSYVLGTVEVTLRGQTKRVEAKMFGDDIVAYGMVGRYQSATKLWPANVASRVVNGTIREDAHFGRDDNHPKFRKENNIWFA